MADIEQWVNLTVNDRWLGDGLTSRDRMGTRVRVRFEFAPPQRANAFITKNAFLLNASYTATERPRREGFRPGEFTRRRVRTDRNGVYVLTTNVTLAGGDEFDFEGEDEAGNTVRPDTLVTRRKLYYQIIRMAGAPLPAMASIENEYWKTSDNLYIKLVPYSPGRTITSRLNVDPTSTVDLNQVKADARAQYDNSRSPYAIVILVVRKTCYRGWETRTIPGVTFHGVYRLTTRRVLFDIADPAVEYYNYIRWRSNAGGPWHSIPKARLARSADYDIDIDTTDLPQGVAGRLDYKLRVIQAHGMGASFRNYNLILVASERYDGSPIPVGSVNMILTHEMGHKIGMVPGPPVAHALDTQSTQYTERGHNGRHCYHGTALVPTFVPAPGDPPIVPAPTPDCTMFGDMRNPTGHFCDPCRRSLRKLDLRSTTNPSLRTQF